MSYPTLGTRGLSQPTREWFAVGVGGRRLSPLAEFWASSVPEVLPRRTREWSGLGVAAGACPFSGIVATASTDLVHADPGVLQPQFTRPFLHRTEHSLDMII